MGAPETTDWLDSDLAEQLVAYDEALAAGAPVDHLVTDDLSDGVREGLSCLEMLARLRLSARIADALAPPPDDTQPELSRPGDPGEKLGFRTDAVAAVPARLGRFEIRRILGQGGCGVVFLAHDPALRRLVALKIPRPEALLTPELRQRFLREGRAAAGLDHPNLVTVFEAGEIGALCYLASAYGPGITLKEWLRRHGGPVPPCAAANLVATLAEAMHYAHQHGVCHRDLKPGNILLASEGLFGEAGSGRAGGVSPLFATREDRGLTPPARPLGTDSEREAPGDPLEGDPHPSTAPCDLESATPRIIDFGLAKVLDVDAGEAATRSGAVFGTPQYMAPEQAQGQTRLIGPATDIHALGVILYELLTGQLPYQGNTDLDVMGQVIAAEPGRPGRLRPQVPRDLETICLKCLRKEPARRYASAGDMAEDLRRFLGHEPISARPVSPGERLVLWAARRPAMAAVYGLAALVLMLGGVGGSVTWLWQRSEQARAQLVEEKRQTELARQETERARQRLAEISYFHQVGLAYREWLENEIARTHQLLEDCPPGRRGWEWRYVDRLCHAELFSFGGHGDRALGVSFRKDGPRLVTTSSDHAIRIRDGATGEPILVLRGHTGPVNTVAFSRDGRLVASGSDDQTVKVWDAATGKELRTCRGHTGRVGSLCFDPDGTRLASTSIDKTARVWDAADGPGVTGPREIFPRGA